MCPCALEGRGPNVEEAEEEEEEGGEVGVVGVVEDGAFGRNGWGVEKGDAGIEKFPEDVKGELERE